MCTRPRAIHAGKNRLVRLAGLNENTPAHKPLERIGYSTLTDQRAMTASTTSPMRRCEMILTNRCNFACPYCNGLPPLINRPMTWEEIQTGLECWFQAGLENVRFSGGEPTLHRDVLKAIALCKSSGVSHIGMTSNGSNRLAFYRRLVDAGLTNISISLDASEPELGDHMAGDIAGAWTKVVHNIRELSKITDVIVNVVYNAANLDGTISTIWLAHDLGVKDILLVADSHYTHAAIGLRRLPQAILDAHPILKYRVENALSRPAVRGLSETDAHHCALVLDDSIIAGTYHFPCALYMREGGSPIGKVTPSMRQDRYQWFQSHNTYADPICRQFCVDLYIDYNNAYAHFHPGATQV